MYEYDTEAYHKTLTPGNNHEPFHVYLCIYSILTRRSTVMLSLDIQTCSQKPFLSHETFDMKVLATYHG